MAEGNDRKDAYKKGEADAEDKAHFAELDRHIKEQNGKLDRVVEELRGVKSGLSGLEKREQSRDDIATGTKRAVEEHGKKQVTSRTFYVGIAGLALALYLGVNPPG